MSTYLARLVKGGPRRRASRLVEVRVEGERDAQLHMPDNLNYQEIWLSDTGSWRSRQPFFVVDAYPSGRLDGCCYNNIGNPIDLFSWRSQ